MAEHANADGTDFAKADAAAHAVPHAPHGEEPGAHGHDPHGGHGHNPHLHHHFDTEQQQFDSDKLGMWLFLTTEILLFAGLFCAYAVYRANHPEMFIFSHQFLDVKWGFLNTIILLFSSFTMAWAVRAAQLGQKKLLIPLLTITIVCGLGFLGVKAIEYTAKFKHGTTWGKTFHVTREALEEHLDAETYAALAAAGKLPKEEGGPATHDSKGAGVGSAAPLSPDADTMSASPTSPSSVGGTMPPGPAVPLTTGSAREAGSPAEPSAGETQTQQGTAPATAMPAEAAAPAASTPAGGTAPVVVQEGPGLIATSAVPVPPPGTPPTFIPRDTAGNLLLDHSQVAPAGQGPAGLRYLPSAQRIGTHESSQPPPPPGHKKWHGEIPPNPQVFFSIYFMMTGLHGIHVIIGMICILVVLIISARGGYGADYMTPVDLVGLYWHLVDLIWIFLFPLLYLIH